ncbi:MAG: capsule assembly Wzi family protein, partial [Candidatus Eisenbacteria bacterium]
MNSLSPFAGLDPWTLPLTRGALAHAIIEVGLRPSGEDAYPSALRGLLEELADELAPEIASLTLGRGERSAVTARGALSLEARDRRRGAARAVAAGDLAVRLNRHVFWHQRVEVDSRVGDDPAFLGREWKEGVTGHFTHAYAAVSLPRARLTAGRKPLAWGTGLSGTLLLQGEVPPLDQIGVDARLGPLSGHAFVASLDDLPIDGEKGGAASRFLSGHRLSLRLGSRARVALSETVVYGGEGRGIDWGYANPLLSYYAVDWNEDRDDNVFWSVDAYARAHRWLDLFGELLVDDFQYDRETEPNQIGFLLGVRVTEIPRRDGIFLDAEYLRVNNWVYGHEKPWNRYTHGRALIGHPIGPDADRLLLRLLVRRGRSFEFLLEHEH